MENVELVGVFEAVKVAGGRRQLGEKVGVSHEAVRQWMVAEKVPAERVLAVEKATGVPRERLNSDIYPPKRGK